MKTKFRKPLIVFTPRVCCVIQDAFLLLKNSKTEVFKKQSMMTLNKADEKKLSVLVNSIMSTAEREKNERKDVAIVRIAVVPVTGSTVKESI
jgi:hypothetical protein